MHLKLIYPKWRKLEGQTPFDLPPHGPVVFAAALPDRVTVAFTDENVDALDLNDSPNDRPDLVALSVMLTAQLPRAMAIAEHYRRLGVPTLMGGIAATLHAEELVGRVTSVFLGEAEGRIERVLDDFACGRPQPIYDHLRDPPSIERVGTARRDLLHRERYTYRGVRMVDLVHASRGCRFNCFPCCTGWLGGRRFRPRPIERVVEEIESIDNDRLFLVDNSLAQDDVWLEELLRALIPLGRRWVCHPISDNERLLELAREAGCWYVYQAIFDTSDAIRERVGRYRAHGLGVEGTVILGADEHDPDAIRRLVDFLLEIELDLAEFTIMTPFAHSPIRAQLEREGRILTRDWSEYTCDRVVFQPARMTPTQLRDMYRYAWDTFHHDASRELRMGRMFLKAQRHKAQRHKA